MLFSTDGERDGESAPRRFAQEILHRAIVASHAFDDERQEAWRIHGGERFKVAFGFGNDAATLRQRGFRERAQEIGVHRGQVDGEDDDVRGRDAREDGFERRERTCAGGEIGDDGDTGAGVWAVGATGDEEFARTGRAEGGELALPERLAFDEQRGFIAAHACGAASGEEDGAEGIADCGLRIAD